MNIQASFKSLVFNYNSMRMISLVVFLMLFIIQCKGSEPVNLDCESTCTCKMKTQKLTLDKEFKVICEGTKSEDVLVTEKLFVGQKVPQNDHVVYVLLKNFKSVTINEPFLSRWLAYKSCSMDLWYNAKINFPLVAPAQAESEAFLPYFAGIGIAYTSLTTLPSNLFKERDKTHVKISGSHIKELDLGKLIAGNERGFAIFKVKNSTIDVLKSSQLVKLDGPKNEFKIEDSEIGIVDTGAFVFNETGPTPSVNIKNTDFGIVRKEAVKINDVSLNIMDSSFKYVADSAFKIGEKSEFNMSSNYLNMFQNSFSSFKCSSNQEMSSNFILPLDYDKDCLENKESEECANTYNAKNYMNSACGENTFLVPVHPDEQQSAPVESKESDGYITLPMGILYLFIAVSSSLLLMVLILAAMLVCRKSPKQSGSTPITPHPFFDDTTPVYFSSKSHLGPSVVL